MKITAIVVIYIYIKDDDDDDRIFISENTLY
jgi:hypothetical protein